MPRPIKYKVPATVVKRTKLYGPLGWDEPKASNSRSDDARYYYKLELSTGEIKDVVKPSYAIKRGILQLKKEYRMDQKQLKLELIQSLERGASDSLREYIMSGFTALPDDYHSYYKNGYFGNLCVLCNDAHSNQNAYYLDEDQELRVCQTCNFMVNQAKEIFNNTTPALTYREQLYAHDKELDPNIIKWTHHKSNRHCCYFCEEKINGLRFELMIPTKTDYVGGFTSVCKAHFDRFKNEVPYYYNDSTSSTEAQYDSKRKCTYDMNSHWERSDSCLVCKLQYPISLEEASIRDDRDTWNKHMCPKCTLEEHPHLKYQNFGRYKEAQCPRCNSTIKLDYTKFNRIRLTDDVNLTAALNCMHCIEEEEKEALKGMKSTKEIKKDVVFSTGEIKSRFGENYTVIQPGNNYWLGIEREDLFAYRAYIFVVNPSIGKEDTSHKCIHRNNNTYDNAYDAAIIGYDYFNEHITLSPLKKITYND